MSEFTLVGLQVVVEVARTGSFTAAAVTLGYTQSAVSRQVAAAERTAGTPLFERRPRGVSPTAAGEALIRHAARVLDSVTSAEQELAGLRDHLAGKLNVGGFPTAMAVLVPRALANLRVKHPGLEVQLTEASTPALLKAVQRGRLDIAVVAAGTDLPDYDFSGVQLEQLSAGPGAGVAVCEQDPLATCDRLSPADLEQQPWIAGPARADGPEFEAWPELSAPRIVHRAKEWPTRLGLVAAGLGIAVVPGIAAEAMPRGVRWIPVTPSSGLGRQMYLVRRSGSREPATRALSERIHQEMARLERARWA